MDAGFGPVDPLAGLEDSHNGVSALRVARDLLAAGEGTQALTAVADARRLGVPAEATPHACIAEGAALIQVGDTPAAVTLLMDAWRDYPDIAALPALLAI